MTNSKSPMSAMHQRFLQLTSTTPAVPEVAAVASDEASLVAILYRPVEPGQHRDGHTRKEQEIAEIFAGLSIERARTLHRRLSSAAAGDPLVVAFARLIPERRARLIAFLGDARRRAALQAA